MTTEVHVISHTHWDREWYLTREEFRLRLVDLIDRLLDLLDRDPEFAHFHLDGQTIVLEDYLEMRPAQIDRLKRTIGEGRVLVGPWYVMPDEFLASGEALVRNLCIGHRMAQSFGRSMPVGYLPDLFGHVAQMPQLLRQFGLDNAILWRGFGGRRAEYWWDAPDGSRVLMLHLPPEGYCNATRVVFNPREASARAHRAIELERGRTGTSQVLLMNGVDHVEPHPGIPALVARISTLDGCRARHSTLPAYVAAVREEIRRAGNDGLETVGGELRGGEDYANLLPGVLSARTYLKQENARVQTLLEREAEPLCTFASLAAGAPYPHGELEYAWKTLIQNHPHDSICGCSIDAVHAENMTRFARAGQVAEALAARAAAQVASRISAATGDSLRIVVFNTDCLPRRGVVEATVDLPYASAEPHRRVDPEALDLPVRFWPEHAFVSGVSTASGEPLPFQVLETADAIATVMSRFETPWQLRATRVTFLFQAPEIPPCGYAAFDVQVGLVGQEPNPTCPPNPADPPHLPYHSENEHLRLTVNDNATVDIEEKSSGWIVRGALTLEDVGDVGDEYNYSPPALDTRICRVSEPARITATRSGPLRTTYRIDAKLQLPAAAAADRRSRLPETVPMPVSFEVSLDAGSRSIEVGVTIENRACDHRLRLLIPTGARRVDFARSDSAFACIARPSERQAPPGPLMELPVSAFPFQTFVDAGDENGGVTVMSHGLAEYEIAGTSDGSSGRKNAIAVTLIRAVGDLSREDLVTRPSGHAGPAVRTPGAQCPGRHHFRLAIAPRAAAPSAGSLFAASRAFVLRPRIAPASDPHGNGAAQGSFVTVESEDGGAVLSALKNADRRTTVIVRLFNPDHEPCRVRVSLAGGLTGAFDVDLLEERRGELAIEGGAAVVDLAPAQIRTVEIRNS